MPLVMAPGSTSVQVEGSLAPGERLSYQVRARAGQYLMALINSANPGLSLEIHEPDGSVRIPSGQRPDFWQGSLPEDGNYLISVISNGTGASFVLNITIPVRVEFQSGAVSATLQGQVTARGVNTYLLRALKGQTMTVTVTSANRDIFLTIYGLEDGQPYIRSATGRTSAALELPATQDYVIELVSSSDAAEDYTVGFVVK